MDIEDLDSLTYEKLLSSYSFIPQIDLDQISKAIDKRISLEILPPFVTVSLDAREEPEIGFEQLLLIWTTYLNKGFPKDIIKLEDNNIFYITRYEDGIMIAKNQDGDALLFVGKFNPGDLVFFSYAGSDVEKIIRLKLLMNLHNTAVQYKSKLTEKKKSEK